MSAHDAWPRGYRASRERFVDLARACGARLDSRRVAAAGPRGEPLSIDTAVLHAGRVEHLIVLTGGVHGVEGPLGGAVLTRVLERLAHDALPDGTGVALVHAVNPWGFAHLRRVDDRNVDVNRNFLDPALPRTPPSPGYAALDPLINPGTAPGPGDEPAFWSRAARLIVRERGLRHLAGAIAEGQDRYPKGLFFAGTEIGESCGILQELLLGLSSDADRVTHLDLHSGLGPSGVATLIAATNVGPVEGRAGRLRAHYGSPVTLDDAVGNAYDARGTLARWYRRALVDRPYLYLCVEIGTVHPLRVLSALRRENRAHHWTAEGSRPHVDAKRALLEAFSPDSARWRARSVAQGLHAFDRTLVPPADARRHGVAAARADGEDRSVG